MTDQKIESFLDKVRNKMIHLKDNKFFGSLKIEVEYKDGGICAGHIGDREKIL